MTLSQAQLSEAIHLLHQMLSDIRDSWSEQHLTVWRVGK